MVVRDKVANSDGEGERERRHKVVPVKNWETEME